jgi:hypothetical protein
MDRMYLAAPTTLSVGPYLGWAPVLEEAARAFVDGAGIFFVPLVKLQDIAKVRAVKLALCKVVQRITPPGKWFVARMVRRFEMCTTTIGSGTPPGAGSACDFSRSDANLSPAQ